MGGNQFWTPNNSIPSRRPPGAPARRAELRGRAEGTTVITRIEIIHLSEILKRRKERIKEGRPLDDISLKIDGAAIRVFPV